MEPAKAVWQEQRACVFEPSLHGFEVNVENTDKLLEQQKAM